jgi:hypothetical protein
MPVTIQAALAARLDEHPLARLDESAGGGGRLAGAAAAAIREEVAAARGSPPTHDQLHALGYAGISELLRFRRSSSASATQS